MKEYNVNYCEQGFCGVVCVHFLPLMIPKLTPSKIVEISVESEETHEILYVLSVIDDSQVPIVALKMNSKSYYYRKGFYSTLIQGIVDKKCLFWNFDYRWADSIYNWYLFKNIDIGKRIMKGKFLLYKTIEDATYSLGPLIYFLSREK